MTTTDKPTCNLCKITGTITCFGIAGYAFYERNQVELPAKDLVKAYRKAIVHQRVLTGMTGGIL